MLGNKVGKYLSEQYRGMKGLATTNYKTPKVYTKQERTQKYLKNMANPLSTSRYSVDSYKKVGM
jgi:hypothetical protein